MRYTFWVATAVFYLLLHFPVIAVLQGSDAYVLLKSSQGNPFEREHPANHPRLRGFEVIDEEKEKIETICPKSSGTETLQFEFFFRCFSFDCLQFPSICTSFHRTRSNIDLGV